MFQHVFCLFLPHLILRVSIGCLFYWAKWRCVPQTEASYKLKEEVGKYMCFFLVSVSWQTEAGPDPTNGRQHGVTSRMYLKDAGQLCEILKFSIFPIYFTDVNYRDGCKLNISFATAWSNLYILISSLYSEYCYMNIIST